MPSTEQLRTRLIEKLKELFQLDQPDLDFGFYRIMHAKSKQVTEFLENDLLAIVSQAFGEAASGKTQQALAAARQKVEQALGANAIDEHGAINDAFAETPAGKEYKAAFEKAHAAQNTAQAEGEIYDHLYRFFERYYEDGDFISRRYYTRETDSKAAPFAIPYNGEEVKLHWANADQYYIKTAEHFSNFTVDLRQAREIQAQQVELGLGENSTPIRVHFTLVKVAEGEHGNVKTSDVNRRFFLLHEANPVGFNDLGELELRFEYRTDPDRAGQDAKWQEKRRDETVTTLLAALEDIPGAQQYHRLLAAKAPTEANKDRTVLAKYLYQYTARNTCDYFIHKDLGGFLRRELDFYIKNEVMRLDAIQDAECPAVNTYLDNLRTLRTIAHHLIDFLAQLEDFQKRLWLKKKFVISTDYCITLDRIPVAFYADIAANDDQRKEWVRLFHIADIKANDRSGLLDQATPGYTEPLTVDFLKSQPHLLLDTALFEDVWKQRLIASLQDLDSNMNGFLIHSENSQGLRLIARRYTREVRTVYIDPPYNTPHSEIAYKNQYKNATWLTLINNNLEVLRRLWMPTFSFGVAIDDFEFVKLCGLLDDTFPELERSVIVVNHHPQGAGGKVSRTHEYFVVLTPTSSPPLQGRPKNDEEEDRNFMRSGTAENNYRAGRWKSFYALIVNPATREVVGAEPPVPIGEQYPIGHTDDGFLRVYPINSQGEERVWRSSFETGKRRAEQGELSITERGTVYQRINHEGKRETLFSNWTASEFNAGVHGTGVLSDVGLGSIFDYPKSIFTMDVAMWALTFGDRSAVVLDYFGGSGTTGHAVINLNRQDRGSRKYTLIEMGNYFDTVLKPRIAKAVYAAKWSNGKPQSRDSGISHCFKYIRLESYEDALNNLQFTDDPVRTGVLRNNPDLRKDYMLRYMLDVETRGSQSLLNIEAFTNPTAYTLKTKKPGSDEYEERPVDLLETFNYLIGLRVEHIAVPQRFNAKFKREADPELPEDTQTRLVIDGRFETAEDGKWWFRKVEGWVPSDPEHPNNGHKNKVLIVWRNLPSTIERGAEGMEEDNLMLDEWFKKNRISTRDFEFDTISVNGSNNLPNLRQEGDKWKVRLIEEDFMKRMWDVEDV